MEKEEMKSNILLLAEEYASENSSNEEERQKAFYSILSEAIDHVKSKRANEKAHKMADL